MMKQQIIDVAADTTMYASALGVVAGLMHWVLAIPSAVYACLKIYDWYENRKDKNKSL